MDIRFLIRSVAKSDLPNLLALAAQAPLVNLPPEQDALRAKIDRSLQAFANRSPENPEYLFVLEDVDRREVVGASLIIARYASPQSPHYYFDVCEKAGKACSNGQELRLGVRTSGLSAIGGLVLDQRYRGHPEKRGRQISLLRFVFMGMFPGLFEDTVLSEMMAPLAPDGANRFWDALGRRLTGMSYAEAFERTRRRQRDFIPRHFPAVPTLLPADDPDLRCSREQVLELGKPEQRILEKVGFVFSRRVDPMDGALHYEAQVADISIVRNGRYCRVAGAAREVCQQSALLGFMRGSQFLGGQYPVQVSGDTALLPEAVMDLLGLENGARVYLSLLES